jgi:hypothetical protein
MNALDVILFLLAAVFFALAAFGIGSPRVSLGWLGLFCCALDWLLHAIK